MAMASSGLSLVSRRAPSAASPMRPPALMRGHNGNLLVEGKSVVMAEHMLAEGPPNGPGDLVSALFLAHVLTGGEPVSALEKATASVFEIVVRAARRGSSELMLAADKGSIMRPMAMINLRAVMVPDKAGR